MKPNPAVERDCAKARSPSLYYKGFPNLASGFEISISLPFSVPFQIALLASCEKVKDC